MSTPNRHAGVVSLTVKGQIGRDLARCLDDLDTEFRPRHTVLVTRSDDVADLVALLRALERRGVVVDRITHSGSSTPSREECTYST